MKKILTVALLAQTVCATDIPLMYEYTLMAKAAPDEMFFGIGNTNNLFVATGIDREACLQAGGQPKVNQAYVWGLTRAGDDLWFGTGPNVNILVSGTYFGSTNASLKASRVAEYGSSAFARAGIVPPEMGDWRPTDVFVYSIADQSLERLDETLSTNDQELLEQVVGLRSAGTSAPNATHPNGVVILGGPSLTATTDGGIILFAFDPATRTLIKAKRFTQYSNIRKWLLHNEVLYTTITDTVGDGEVLRWINDPTHVDYPLAFETVGELDNGGAELAIYNNRLFVGTWPGVEGVASGDDIETADLIELLNEPAGIYRSPSISEEDGLTASDTDDWDKVWDITEYDSDDICAAVTGIGALHEFDGALYWGTMHVAGLTAFAQGMNIPATNQTDLDELYLNSWRSIALFRDDTFQPKKYLGFLEWIQTQDYHTPELLYGEESLMCRDVYISGDIPDWESRSTGFTPLYGSSGFDNPYNTYTWTMAVYSNRLFVGTMDSIGLSQKYQYPQSSSGADLWAFCSSNEPARPVSTLGVGNYSTYGIRTMLGCDDGLFLGTANPMNLMTDLTDEYPEGGWELLRLRQRFIDTDWDDLPDSWETDTFGNIATATGSAASDDDPISNLDEFIAGTDPLDSSDYFYISAQSDAVEWNSATGRVYSVQTATDLGGPWTTITNLTGTGSPLAFNRLSQTNSAQFFRIEANVLDGSWETIP
jgi:hypothetical protein